jgi:hypothetical protein
LIGYENGLSVRVNVPAAPAAYRVEVEADGDVLSLSYEVIADKSPRSVGERRITGDHIEMDVSAFGDLWQLAAVVVRRGESLGPREATVRVYRDDTLVADITFEPGYRISEPNGPGCGKQTLAVVSLEVP